jgi:phosphate transport system protein
MKTHMDRELTVLKNRLLELAGDVNSSLNMTYKALLDQDKGLANQVIKHDDDIDNEEINIEEDCLKILALYQPVASNLREVISILKINNDLERIGDLCVNICRYLKKIMKAGPVEVPELFNDMFPKVLNMMNLTIDCCYNNDLATAIKVCNLDFEVDKVNKELITQITERISQNDGNLTQLMFFFSMTRTLERIGDYFTNICEDIYYTVSGSIVRHNSDLMIAEDEDD